ncbi:MAG TPA: hypothetical protein VLC46_15680 [Thermoanaerobaculia bacterium]|jgi:hypothetical protein|nr:hypothetical protein [Thermoanaerobaculia bacterium]
MVKKATVKKAAVKKAASKNAKPAQRAGGRVGGVRAASRGTE